MLLKKILAVMLSLSMLPFAFVQAAEEEKFVSFFDDFESYNTQDDVFGVYKQEQGARLLNVVDSGTERGKVGEIGLVSSMDNNQMRWEPKKPIEGGKIRLSFSALVKDGLAGHFTFQSEGNPYTLLYFTGGEIRIGMNNNSSGAEPSAPYIMAYTEGEWYDIDVVLDLEKDCFSVVVENEHGRVEKIEHMIFRICGLEPAMDVDAVQRFVFQTWSHKDGSILVDDIKIEHHPAVVASVETGFVGNVFGIDDEKKFDVSLMNTDDEAKTVKVTYEANADRFGRLYYDEKEVTLEAGGEFSESIAVEMDKFDVASFDITIDDGLGEPITECYDFSTVNKCVDGEVDLGFGINSHSMRDGTVMSIEEDISLMKAAGIGYSRGSFEWKSVEQEKGKYSVPEYTKEYARECVKNGIQPLIILAFGNQYYDQGGPPYSEEGLEAWLKYVKFMVDTFYPLGVRYFEIWNEYDLEGSGFNTTSRPPEDYRRMLIMTSKMIKEMHSDIVIVGGALAESDNMTWLGTVLDEGGLQAIDKLSIHPYNHSEANDASNYTPRMEKIIETMKKYGDPVPIWVTEYGYYVVDEEGVSTHTQLHTESEVAAWNIRTKLISDVKQTVESVCTYAYNDYKFNPNFGEGNFGMLKNGPWMRVPYAAKPRYLATANVNKQLANTSYIENFSPDTDTYFAKYKKSDGNNVYAVWNYYNRKTVAFKSDVSAELFDMYGNSLGTVKPLDGVLQITVTEEPCYMVTALDKIEFTDPTIKFVKDEMTAIYGDMVNIEVVKSTDAPLNIEVIPDSAGSLKESTGFVGNTARASIDITDDRSHEEVFVTVRVSDDSGNVYFDGQSYVEIMQEQYAVDIVTRPYDFSNLNRWQAVITIKNNAATKEASGTVEISSPDVLSSYCKKASFKNLKGGAEKIIKINLPEMVKKKTTNIVTNMTIDGDRTYTYTNKVNFAVASYAYDKPTIDGVAESGEWRGTILTTDSANADIVSTTESFAGDSDLSSKVRLMWDEDYLYAMFDVTDDVQVQNFEGVEIWRGDSVQMGVDDANATYVTQFTEMGASLKSDGEVELWRWSTMAANNDVYEDNETKIVRRDDGHTIYEMKIPWAGLVMKPEEVKNRYDLGFNLVINDADKFDRKGWHELADGIAWHKNTTQFTRLILEKPEN